MAGDRTLQQGIIGIVAANAESTTGASPTTLGKIADELVERHGGRRLHWTDQRAVFAVDDVAAAADLAIDLQGRIAAAPRLDGASVGLDLADGPGDPNDDISVDEPLLARLADRAGACAIGVSRAAYGVLAGTPRFHFEAVGDTYRLHAASPPELTSTVSTGLQLPIRWQRTLVSCGLAVSAVSLWGVCAIGAWALYNIVIG